MSDGLQFLTDATTPNEYQNKSATSVMRWPIQISSQYCFYRQLGNMSVGPVMNK